MESTANGCVDRVIYITVLQLAAMQKQLEEATTAQSLLQESITQSDSDEGLEERELD